MDSKADWSWRATVVLVSITWHLNKVSIWPWKPMTIGRSSLFSTERSSCSLVTFFWSWSRPFCCFTMFDQFSHIWYLSENLACALYLNGIAVAFQFSEAQLLHYPPQMMVLQQLSWACTILRQKCAILEGSSKVDLEHPLQGRSFFWGL